MKREYYKHEGMGCTPNGCPGHYKPHVCRESRSCVCSIQALEPDEECPVHGVGEWPPRCDVCGRFMKWSKSSVFKSFHP